MTTEATAEATETKAPKAPEAKTDPETEETAAEISERAQTAAKRGKFAEASNAYRRAAKLESGDAAKTLNGLADQFEAQAKEKGQPMTKKAKAEKKPKKEKKIKAAKAAKAPRVKKVKAEPKHKYPSTPAEKRAAAERTAAFFKSAAKREELNDAEKAIHQSIRVGSDTTIDKMSDLAPKSWPAAKRKSWVRNALRGLRAMKKFKKIDRGTYKKVA